VLIRTTMLADALKKSSFSRCFRHVVTQAWLPCHATTASPLPLPPLHLHLGPSAPSPRPSPPYLAAPSSPPTCLASFGWFCRSSAHFASPWPRSVLSCWGADQPPFSSAVIPLSSFLPRGRRAALTSRPGPTASHLSRCRGWEPYLRLRSTSRRALGLVRYAAPPQISRPPVPLHASRQLLDERRDRSHHGRGIRICHIHVYAGLPSPYPICMLADGLLCELARPRISTRVTLENPTRRYP
jgi:hypothetical protein